MGQESKIEWTDHTFNPWWGCTKVSPGCKFCYAETLATRWDKDVWGPKKPRRMMSEAYWKQPERWNREAEAAGVRKRVFCASMADVFEGPSTMPEESWAPVHEARHRLLDLIHDTPNLDWQLLTKRPQNVGEMYRDWLENTCGSSRYQDNRFDYDSGYLTNICLGTSVESQKEADERIPELLKIPAKVRFLSCEPLIGPVLLESYVEGHEPRLQRAYLRNTVCPATMANYHTRVDWVICGGESGHGARPMHPDWARSLRDQCTAAGVPFFFKQFGEWLPVFDRDIDDPDWGKCDRVAHDHKPGQWWNLEGGTGFHGNRVVWVQKVGKNRAGRLLDGRTWDEFPKVEA